MPRQTPFRPEAPDALEQRQLLSAAGLQSVGHRLAALRARAGNTVDLLHQKIAPPEAPSVAVLGDDLSDEYIGDAPARNWLEILAATGQINPGPFQRESMGPPRGAGFTLNWSQRGATTEEALRLQLPGLAQQVASGKVGYVILQIGANDFTQYLDQRATDVLRRPGIVADELNAVERKASQNFDQMFYTLMRANPDVRLVVTTVPDITRLPTIRNRWDQNSHAGAEMIQAARKSIQLYNTQLRSYARGNPRVVVADIAKTIERRLRGPGPFRLAQTKIQTGAPGNDYHQFLLADGSRPGTVAQSLIANELVAALNRFPIRLRPVASTDILKIAQQAQDLGVSLP